MALGVGAVPSAEHELRIAGLRVYIRVVGEGPPVLLINGLGANTDMWGPLERALDGCRVIEFDAPGTGRSSTPPYVVSVPMLAWLATKVLDEVGVRQADVLGYSMGGIITQQLAAQSPERVRRAVLVGTSCGLGAVPGSLGPLMNLATPFRYWSPEFHRRTIGSLVGGRARHDAVWAEEYGALRRSNPPSARGYTYQLWSLQWTTLPLLSRIKAPVLIVTGDDDPLVPAANAMVLGRRLRDARVLLAEGEGHMLLLDDESPVLAPVRDFLTTTDLGSARVWQKALVPTDADVSRAMADGPRQAQPWGAVARVIRAVCPAGS